MVCPCPITRSSMCRDLLWLRATVSFCVLKPRIRNSIVRPHSVFWNRWTRAVFSRCPIRLLDRIRALERSSTPPGRVFLILGVALFLLGGCRQQMADQPKYNPLTASTFFDDGRSARPLVVGTVPRGSLAEDNLNVPKDANTFPIPVTRELLARGRERFNIYGAVFVIHPRITLTAYARLRWAISTT